MTSFGWPERPVAELVTGPAIAVDHRATLETVIETMAQLGLGLVVVTEAGKVVGVVSERDIIWSISRGAVADEVWAADVMTPDPTFVDADTTLAGAALTMAVGSHRHVLVRTNDGISVLSVTDLLSDIAVDVSLSGS